MSDLAFGKPLNMLESNEFHFTVGLLQDGMDLLGPLSPVPWLVRIGYSIPRVAQNFKNLLTWSARKLEYRLKVGRPSTIHARGIDLAPRMNLLNKMSLGPHPVGSTYADAFARSCLGSLKLVLKPTR